MSFDSCVSDNVKRFLATVRNNDLSQAQKVPNNDNMLWELGNKIPHMLCNLKMTRIEGQIFLLLRLTGAVSE